MDTYQQVAAQAYSWCLYTEWPSNQDNNNSQYKDLQTGINVSYSSVKHNKYHLETYHK